MGRFMRIIRNRLLPILSAGLGAFLGFMAIGLPGLNIVPTIDGSPVVGGFLPPEQVQMVIREGKVPGSYIDLYGIALPGQPLYWAVGTIALMALIGYRLGLRFWSDRA